MLKPVDKEKQKTRRLMGLSNVKEELARRNIIYKSGIFEYSLADGTLVLNCETDKGPMEYLIDNDGGIS